MLRYHILMISSRSTFLPWYFLLRLQFMQIWTYRFPIYVGTSVNLVQMSVWFSILLWFWMNISQENITIQQAFPSFRLLCKRSLIVKKHVTCVASRIHGPFHKLLYFQQVTELSTYITPYLPADVKSSWSESSSASRASTAFCGVSSACSTFITPGVFSRPVAACTLASLTAVDRCAVLGSVAWNKEKVAPVLTSVFLYRFHANAFQRKLTLLHRNKSPTPRTTLIVFPAAMCPFFTNVGVCRLRESPMKDFNIPSRCDCYFPIRKVSSTFDDENKFAGIIYDWATGWSTIKAN